MTKGTAGKQNSQGGSLLPKGTAGCNKVAPCLKEQPVSRTAWPVAPCLKREREGVYLHLQLGEGALALLLAGGRQAPRRPFTSRGHRGVGHGLAPRGPLHQQRACREAHV